MVGSLLNAESWLFANDYKLQTPTEIALHLNYTFKFQGLATVKAIEQLQLKIPE